MAKINPKTLLEELCKNAHPRKEASLRLIFRLCEEQHERGSRDFSVATIGRLSQSAGGPSSSAIRNKTGNDYKALMLAFADSVGGKSKKTADRKPSVLEEILEGVTDPVLRARVGILLAELESARGQVSALRHLANQTTVLELGGLAAQETVVQASAAFSLSRQERTALERAISPDTLTHWGWIADPNGRVKTDNGQMVFSAGYLTAIQKVLAVA